jgi:hypothetical protein
MGCSLKGLRVPDKWFRGIFPTERGRPVIDTSVAHSARVYDYLIGGKDNFAADRLAGDLMIEALPSLAVAYRMNRAFLARVVRFLVTECGIRQFLDVGAGIPAAINTHEVAQAVAPQARVVYVDKDPLVLAHARALLTSPAEGAIAYVEADLRRPDDILAGARHALDFSQPIALMMLMVLHMIPDAARPHHIVARLVGALPGGSYLALSHPPSDILPESAARVQQLLNAHLGAGASMTARSHDEVARFCDGLEIIPPGVVQVHQWRPADGAHSGGPTTIWCAVARKPQGDVPLPG